MTGRTFPRLAACLTVRCGVRRQGQYEAALVDFETVLGSKPTDREEAVASYNVACCYSKLGNVSAAQAATHPLSQAATKEVAGLRL